ncbi:hydantoinase/oxoprolinase family protein [Rhodoligotrophos ferricapiens]|uniref:hydantoinase/oxoprolinase family protein n=1 Tax=Rhodoligotrophos ferricapiens TaxID=3069264 RepID=UPI00315C7EBC
MSRFLSVDIGGTHTDLIYIDEAAGRVSVAKVPTTPENQAEGLFNGTQELGIALADVDLVIHGTTVATNAVIERKGARCGLITTEGFRDVLELRRRDRPHTFGLTGTFQPLIERSFRREVKERVSAEGEILHAVDPSQVREVAEGLLADGAEVLVICFMNAYANPGNERAAYEAVKEFWPNDYIAVSSQILPAIREFERTSTTVVSGYVQPLLSRYFRRLTDRLQQYGYKRDLLIVQSNGGLMSAEVAPRLAANTILSGPAGGATAAAAIAHEMGLKDVVSADVGGTSLDICLIRGGQPSLTQQKALEFGIPLATPMLDIDAVGAGGGSLAWIDKTGILQIGPESAGSDPGPACYGRGTQPTITDAALVTGLLDPETAIGQKHGRQMNPELSRKAIDEKVGGPLKLDTLAAAEAILTVGGHKVSGHLRRRLVERGHDPRAFSLVAFGGAGPLFANRILRQVGLARAIIPYFPGITSALGCLLGQLRHDFVRTVNYDLAALDPASLREVYEAYEREGHTLLAEEGVEDKDVQVRLGADMAYRGQTHTIQVAFPEDMPLTREAIRNAFDAAYRERFSVLLDRSGVILVNVRLTVSSAHRPPRLSELIEAPDSASEVKPTKTQPVFFDGQWHEASVFDRFALPRGASVAGPAILSQPDATTFVEPGFRAVVHDSLNIIVEAAS